MTELFYTVLKMSGSGLLAAMAAGLVGLLFRRVRCSKTALLLLWLAAAFRLLCPWSPPSPLSLFNWDTLDRYAVQAAEAGERIYTGDVQQAVNWPDDPDADYGRAVSAGVEPVRNGDTGLMEVHYYETGAGEIVPARTLWESCGPVLSALWLAGAGGFLAYGAVTYVLLKRRLRFAVRDDALRDVWYSDRIPSPCVAGLFRPRIYLTFGMTEEETAYVLAHERQHVKNGDHLWKVLGWLIMCVHWFNPLLWLMYRVFLMAVEDACDQRVLRELGEEKRADYGQALLALSAGRRSRLGPSPIAFGEGDTKGRIRTILRYKRPLVWLTVLAAAVAAVVGVSVLTSRTEDELADGYGEYEITGLIYLSPLSAQDEESFLTEYRGSAVGFGQGSFSVAADRFAADSPRYEEMALGDTLESSEDGGLFTIDLTAFGSVRGWKVLTADGGETGYHVFLADGRLWVGKYRQDSYLYIAEAALASGFGGPLGEEVRGWVRWEFTPGAGAGLSSVYPGLPIAFDLDYDRLEAACDKGSLCLYDTGTGETEAMGSALTAPSGVPACWVPYGAGDPDTLLDGADIVFTLYRDGQEAASGTIVIRREEQAESDGAYTVQAYLSGIEGDCWFSLDGEVAWLADALYHIRRVGTQVSEWRADLTHDGAEEIIAVYGEGWDDLNEEWMNCCLTVTDGADRLLWYDSAGWDHVGQNGIYLYQRDGEYYLMQWVPYSSTGTTELSYRIFSLTGEVWSVSGDCEAVLAQNSFGYALIEPQDYYEVDAAGLRAFEAEINALLADSVILLSTNGDGPEYSTPEDPAVPDRFISDADYFASLQEPLAVWYADLTHDGADETITVAEEYDYTVTVTDSGGQVLWTGEAGAVHAGQNGIYLCELDGAYYLMEWLPYSISGSTSLAYRVFSLTSGGAEQVLAEDHIYFEYEDILAVDTETFRAIERDSMFYLSHSIVLASTNEDTEKDESGRYQYYSTPDHILTPVLDRAQWGLGAYSSFLTPEYFEDLQALARGTYTFTGEVLSVGEDRISVMDQSLWSGIEHYGELCFTVPVDDPSVYEAGDIVQVTADGFLYRRELPSGDTHVQVALLEG